MDETILFGYSLRVYSVMEAGARVVINVKEYLEPLVLGGVL